MNFHDFVFFSIAWWVFLMCILPIGLEYEEFPQKGIMKGTPKKTYIGTKMLISTIISAACTVGLHFAKLAGYIKF